MSDARRETDVEELRRLYAGGANLMEHLRSRSGTDQNDETTIQLSYDIQAGSYVAALADPAAAELKRRVGAKLAAIFQTLGASVIAEAGVGEATTLAAVLAQLEAPTQVLGFDISFSRLLHARRHLTSQGRGDVVLFTGALGAIPIEDDAVDLVYTFHTIEPNGGREREVLAELLRIVRHHLVLVEPSNELGSETTRERIERLRYVKNLHATLVAMGCNVIRFEPWGIDVNPQNEAALIVVEKRPRSAATAPSVPSLASPYSRRPLVTRRDCLYSAEDGRAFPVIAGIPCLLRENGIIATQLGRLDA